MAAQNFKKQSTHSDQSLILSEQQASYLDLGLPVTLPTHDGSSFTVQSLHVIYGEFGLQHEMGLIQNMMEFTRKSLIALYKSKLTKDEIREINSLFDTMANHIQVPLA